MVGLAVLWSSLVLSAIGVRAIGIGLLTKRAVLLLSVAMDSVMAGLVLGLIAWSAIGLAVVRAVGVPISLGCVGLLQLSLTITH